MRQNLWWTLVSAACAALVACGGDGGTTNDPDPDVGADTSTDAGGDVAADTADDAETDAPDEDAAPDAEADAGPDIGAIDWTDSDEDGAPDRVDNCVNTPNADQADRDRDGVGDECDLCPTAFDPDQTDSIGDGVGDACREALCTTGIFCGEGEARACCGVGEECVADACVALCPFSVRCGGTCCDEGSLCIADTCTPAGEACASDSDCPWTAFCDRALNRCVEFGDDLDCRRPGELTFDPETLWHWAGVEVDGVLYENVVSTPMVADVDADGTPEVVAPAYGTILGQGVLVILDGETGVLEQVNATRDWRGTAHVALGNLDDDPALEIVAMAVDGIVVLDDPVACPDPDADDDGCAVWDEVLDDLGSFNAGQSIALADFDGDGTAEIVMGNEVWSATGERIAVAGESDGSGIFGNRLSAVADVIDDGLDETDDGLPELITGDCVWQIDVEGRDATEVWCSDETANGYSGVADLTDAFGPEVVTVRSGEVFVFNGQSGATLHRFTVPGGGHGGAPNLADFDGDGRVEIGTAGQGCYTVFDLDCVGSDDEDAEGCTRPAFDDCTPGVDCDIAEPCPDLAGGTGDGVLWSVATQDISSSSTGSSVFDFQGDGTNEVIYNDECRFLALDGASGRPFLARYNTSRTATEYPIVVDVDGDDRSEVVVAANRDQFGRDCASVIGDRPDLFPDCVDGAEDRPAFCDEGTAGIVAFRDAESAWVRTRPIWNQHAYHITNVNEDGTVATRPDPFWTTFNTFRANRQGEALLNAPDLVIRTVLIDPSECPLDQIFEIRIANEGSLTAAPGVPVAVYDADSGALLGQTATATFIPPGGSEEVVWVRPGPFPAVYDFVVRVAPDGAADVLECDAENNEYAVRFGCPCQEEFCDGIDNNCDLIVDDADCLECGEPGDACEDDADCCGDVLCLGGTCAEVCRPFGVGCTDSGQCCDAMCSGTVDEPGICIGN